MQEFEIIFYEKADGTEPAKDFILSLDTKMRAKMFRTVELLQKNGNRLREPESKPIEDGIMELRAKVGSDISRVLYFFVVGHKVVLTNGFIKKTQKTPRSEIERAKQYRADYLSRKDFTSPKGEVRSVLCSEVGYSSSSGAPAQASSLVFAYLQAENVNPAEVRFQLINYNKSGTMNTSVLTALIIDDGQRNTLLIDEIK